MPDLTMLTPSFDRKYLLQPFFKPSAMGTICSECYKRVLTINPTSSKQYSSVFQLNDKLCRAPGKCTSVANSYSKKEAEVEPATCQRRGYSLHLRANWVQDKQKLRNCALFLVVGNANTTYANDSFAWSETAHFRPLQITSRGGGGNYAEMPRCNRAKR